jgi:RNA polymerase sigma-70 factor, ECF subfamily
MKAYEERRSQFEYLAMPHIGSLLRSARRLTRSMSEADDLVQETMLSAWRSFHRFKIGTDCKSWLFRILLNAFSHQRVRLRRSEQVVSDRDAESCAASGGSDVLLNRQIDVALHGLPEEQRLVLVLAAVEGFSCREIAEVTNVPLGTVMSRLSRARGAMRATLLNGVKRTAGTSGRKVERAHGM